MKIARYCRADYGYYRCLLSPVTYTVDDLDGGMKVGERERGRGGGWIIFRFAPHVFWVRIETGRETLRNRNERNKLIPRSIIIFSSSFFIPFHLLYTSRNYYTLRQCFAIDSLVYKRITDNLLEKKISIFTITSIVLIVLHTMLR